MQQLRSPMSWLLRIRHHHPLLKDFVSRHGYMLIIVQHVHSVLLDYEDDKEQRFSLLPELQLSIHESYDYPEEVPPSLTWIDAVSLSLPPPSFSLNRIMYIWRLTTLYIGIW